MLSAFPVPEVVADFADLGVEVASSDFVALSYLLELLLYELVYSPSCWGFPAGVLHFRHLESSTGFEVVILPGSVGDVVGHPWVGVSGSGPEFGWPFSVFVSVSAPGDDVGSEFVV